MTRYVFKMPDLGEGTVEAEIVAWHVKVGDQVTEDQVMAEVMTEKAAVEVPAPVTGRVVSLAGGPAPQTSLVILKVLQRDPVKGRPLHADFQAISMERKIRVEVPLVLSGDPIGVKDKGGILEHALRQLSVECLPVNIPEKIAVDVSGLDIGDALHVRDVQVAEGIRILDDGARVLASVSAPAAEEVAAPVEEAPAEPEVVGKKEKEEPEAAAEAKPKAGAEAKPKAAPEAKPSK